MYTWVRPLKNKTGQRVTDSFKSILNEKISLMLQSDKGSEYKNAQFQTLLKECGIRCYTCENYNIKAAIVESFNRTLKTRMYKYFTNSKSFRYVDIFQDLVYADNNSHQMSIGMEPAMVTAMNEQWVRRKLFRLQPEKLTWRLQIAQQVRISKRRQVFEKGYLAGWSKRFWSSAIDSPPLL